MGSLVGAGSAAAHSPYFSRTVKTTLNDGQLLELKLLHGDGIFISDPIWIVVIDASGRLRAHSYKSQQMDFFADWSGTWHGYDFILNMVIAPDPAGLFEGEVFPKDRHELGEYRGSFNEWQNRGFVARPATALETLSASVQYIFFYRGSSIFFFLYGVAIGALFLWPSLLSTRRAAVRTAAVVINAFCVLLWSLPALYVVLIGSQPVLIALLTTGAGFLIIAIFGTIARRRQHAIA